MFLFYLHYIVLLPLIDIHSTYMFLIYINDMPLDLSQSISDIFYRHSKSWTISEDLNTIEHWCNL